MWIPPAGSCSPSECGAIRRRSLKSDLTVWKWNLAGSEPEKFLENGCVLVDVDPTGRFLLAVGVRGDTTAVSQVRSHRLEMELSWVRTGKVFRKRLRACGCGSHRPVPARRRSAWRYDGGLSSPISPFGNGT